MPSRRGAVLVAVLAIVGVLAILGLALLFASQEGYNQAAVAVVGQRADLLARSCVDEARDTLNGWMARWPGRVPPGATLDPSAELARRLAATSALRGEVWSEPLTAFGGVNLIADSAAALAREGFALDDARVRFHGFHRVNTAPAGMAPRAYGRPEDTAPAVNDYRGFVSFELALRAERSRSPLKRALGVTFDVAVSDQIPWAGRFALFSWMIPPGGEQVFDDLKSKGLPPEAERTAVSYTDLNRGGGLRIHARGGRVFVPGPYVVASTGFPGGNVPDTLFGGPGVPTDQLWRADTFLGWGGTPAPRAGIVKPAASVIGLAASISQNGRPRDLTATWVMLAPGDRVTDPGAMMPKPQTYFAEALPRTAPDGSDRERRAFSLFGDPGQGAFSPFTGRLVRFPDDPKDPTEELGMPVPDLNAQPHLAWTAAALQPEIDLLGATETGAFAANRDALITYAKRRFAILPEGRLFSIVRAARFDTPLWLTIAKLAYPALVAASTILGGPVVGLLAAGALSPLALLATLDGYETGHFCRARENNPNLPPEGSKPEDNLDAWMAAGFYAVREATAFDACVGGLDPAQVVLPEEVLQPLGAHWQPLVVPDPRAEFFASLAIGLTVLFTGGFASGLLITGLMPVALTAAMGAPAALERAFAVPGPAPAGPQALDASSTTPPHFRDLAGLALRTHDTLDDALQDGPGGKVLLLNGVLRVRQLKCSTPFRYAGRGVVISDDPGQPLLTGPIVPVDFETAELAHWLTIVHWRHATPADASSGARGVRLAAGSTDLPGVQVGPTDATLTTALFRLTLAAEEGARPADGTARAVIQGNYLCGLPNKARIPDASDLHVQWEPRLAQPLSAPVAGISARAIEVHR